MVHDWLLRLGGAERVLIALHRIFPEAPIYTLFYDKKFTGRQLFGAKIVPSFLQKVPNIKKTYPWFKFLMPMAVESLDFSGFDLVISSSHEAAHGIIVKPGTKHMAYYHSPSRLLWDRAHDYLEDFRKRKNDPVKLSLIRVGQHFLRLWDWSASRRPDIMVANSKHVAERINKYYGREARVVYPPVEIRVASGSAHRTTLTRRTGYFLIVSQLYPHKNIELAIKTFKNLPEFDLVVIGQGPEKRWLQKLIVESGNIKLLGFVPDEELPGYYENCLAYLICNEEDFGISPVEAMFFGKPVLALRKGGSIESVIEGETGEFFNEETVEDLASAARFIHGNAKAGRYDTKKMIKHAESFGFDRFKKEILEIVNEMR